MIKKVKFEIILELEESGNYDWVFNTIEEQLESDNNESLVSGRFLVMDDELQ